MALRTRLHHRNPREHPCTLARHGPRKTSNRKGSSVARAVRGALALGGPGGLDAAAGLGGLGVLALGRPVRDGPGVLVLGGLGAAALGAGLLPG